jgi:hypothetical protein
MKPPFSYRGVTRIIAGMAINKPYIFEDHTDTITITRDERNLFYKVNDKEILLVAKDSTHFFALKDDMAITFTKDPAANIPVLTITQNKKNKQYLKL